MKNNNIVCPNAPGIFNLCYTSVEIELLFVDFS